VQAEASSTKRQEVSAHGSKRLSVIVPVLNEAQGVDPLLARLTVVLEASGLDWEVVFVDDGSIDDTLEFIRDRNRRDPRIKAIALSRNFGKEVAVAAGLRSASGEAVVVMDGDLQHPPETIVDFLAKWREGFDIVYGVRADRRADSALRRLLSRVFYRVFRVISGTELPEDAGDFRLLSRRAVDALNRIGERVRFNKGLYSWIGFRAAGVPFEVPQRYAGRSRWSVRKLWRFAIDGVVSFSTVPLRVWSYLGLAISLIAFAFAFVFLVKTMVYGTDLPGFPTLIISIMILSGVQLISLGVIGEYIGRMYEEVKARPLFLVAERIGMAPGEEGCSMSPRPPPRAFDQGAGPGQEERGR